MKETLKEVRGMASFIIFVALISLIVSSINIYATVPRDGGISNDKEYLYFCLETLILTNSQDYTVQTIHPAGGKIKKPYGTYDIPPCNKGYSIYRFEKVN